MRLSETDLESLIAGAAYAGTGGGLPADTQRQQLTALGRRLPALVSLAELPDEAAICSAYGVGPAGSDLPELDQPSRLALAKLESITGYRFAGIFPGESGVEGLVFAAAAALGLPVVDADGTGGRAVPEITIDDFALHGQPIAPVVVASADGEVTVCESGSPQEIEVFVRAVVERTGQSAAVLDHAVTVADAKRLLTVDALSRSLERGRLIEQADSPAAVAKTLSGRVIASGQLTGIDLREAGGFLVGGYGIKEGDQETAVRVKNENICAQCNSRTIAAAPDWLVTIDNKSLAAVHNSQLAAGREVALLRLPAVSAWQTAKAKELWQPVVAEVTEK